MGHHKPLVLAAIQAYKTYINLLIDFSDRVLGEEGEATTTDVKHISDLEQDVNR